RCLSDWSSDVCSSDLRLTGSPNHKLAAEWAIKEMTSWGFDNAHLEPWDFGHPGWVNERLTVHTISPFKDALVCEVLAWTPSTNRSEERRVGKECGQRW